VLLTVIFSWRGALKRRENFTLKLNSAYLIVAAVFYNDIPSVITDFELQLADSQV
jgi:hypothetical protein